MRARGFLGCSANLFGDVGNCRSNGLDFFGILIRNGDVKGRFELHHEFNGVEAICPEIIDEAGLGYKLVTGSSHVFADDFVDLFLNVDVRHGVSGLWDQGMGHLGR